MNQASWIQHKAYLGYRMLFTFLVTRIIGIPGLLRCCTLLLILLSGVVYLDRLSGVQYCISRPANATGARHTHTHILSQQLLMIKQFNFFICLIWLLPLHNGVFNCNAFMLAHRSYGVRKIMRGAKDTKAWTA